MNQEQIDKVLTGSYWPPNLTVNKPYSTTHDDDEGGEQFGVLKVTIGLDGDVWVKTEGDYLRFRTHDGGGKFLKIRNALLLLADAIRQEGEERSRVAK